MGPTTDVGMPIVDRWQCMGPTTDVGMPCTDVTYVTLKVPWGFGGGGVPWHHATGFTLVNDYFSCLSSQGLQLCLWLLVCINPGLCFAVARPRAVAVLSRARH